jgi:hypothetical protein
MAHVAKQFDEFRVNEGGGPSWDRKPNTRKGTMARAAAREWIIAPEKMPVGPVVVRHGDGSVLSKTKEGDLRVYTHLAHYFRDQEEPLSARLCRWLWEHRSGTGTISNIVHAVAHAADDLAVHLQIGPGLDAIPAPGSREICRGIMLDAILELQRQGKLLVVPPGQGNTEWAWKVQEP